MKIITNSIAPHKLNDVVKEAHATSAVIVTNDVLAVQQAAKKLDLKVTVWSFDKFMLSPGTGYQFIIHNVAAFMAYCLPSGKGARIVGFSL